MTLYKSLLLLCAFLALGSALNLTVNASITTASGSNYPNLQSAVAALYSGSTLHDTTNTITLLPNTAGTFQTITTSLNGNSGTGSITIQFQSPPSIVNSLSACNKLPILSVNGTSYTLMGSSLSSLSISGLYIQQRYHNKTSNELENMGTVTFSNFCLDLTEAPGARIPSNYNYLGVYLVSQVTITNGYINYDGTKAFAIESCSQVNVSSLVLNIASYSQDSDIAILQVYQNSFYNTNFGVTNIQITCPNTAIPMPNAILCNLITSAYYANIQVSNCDFSATSVNSPSLIYSAQTTSSIMNNFTFTNIVLGDNAVEALIATDANTNIVISNIQATSLTNSTMETNSMFICAYSNAPASIAINNVSLIGLTLGEYYDYFYFYFDTPDCLSGFLLNNLTVDGGSIAPKSFVILVDFGVTTALYSTQATQATLTVMNLNVLNLISNTQYVVQYDYPISATLIDAVEIIHAEFYNTYLFNNTLFYSYFFHIMGCLTQFVNLTAVNQSLTGLSTLIESRDYVQTLFVINSTFTNFTLNASSALISHDAWAALIFYNDFTETREPGLEYPFLKNSTTLYTETRPFIIYNSVFTNISAANFSEVIWSTNPQAIFQGNTIQNITLNNSRLLQIGGYVLYASIYSYLQNTAGAEFPLPTTTWFDFFVTGETAAFSGNSQMQSLFYNARNQTSIYGSQNCATFIYVKDNIIDQVYTVSSDYLFGLDDFQVPNSSVVIYNNKFSRIQGFSNIDFPIILSDSINRASIIGNSFTQINIPGYIFSLTSTFLDYFLFDSNVISNTSQVGAYLIISNECNNITIQNMIIQNLETETDFISMTCTLIDTQIILKNSTFQNITQQSNEGALQAINFIYISTQNISSSSLGSVTFEDNTFKNITLTRHGGGYTTNVIGTSFILLFMTQSYATLQNNTMTQIVLPEGNIMTISTPNLTVLNSTFDGLSFGDAKGALNLIVQNFTLLNSNFTNCQSTNYIGTGLIMLTAASSVIGAPLRTNISGCTFINNTAPDGAIIYVSDLIILFSLQDSNVLNNLPSSNQGQMYFVNVSESAINIKNSSFIVNQTAQQGTSANYVFYIQSSSLTNLTISSCSYQIAGNNSGGFLYTYLNSGLSTTFTEFSYALALLENNYSSTPQTGILVADRINATFTSLTVSNLTIAQSSMFILNCDTTNSPTNNVWHLSIHQSSFNLLNLTNGIVSINSDEYLKNSLDNLTVSITNSTFSYINLTGSNAIITTTTSLIGNSQTNNFSIIVTNCSFLQINALGGGSAIYSSVESRYRNVLWLYSNNFRTITSNSSLGGAIINPSTSMLSQEFTATNDTTIKVTNNAFLSIQSSQGGIISWVSIYNKIALLVVNNSFTNVSTSQDGGIIYANYSTKTTLNSTRPVIFNFTNNSFNTITAQNGGIMQFIITSAVNVYTILFDSNDYDGVNVIQNGGIINIPEVSSSDSGFSATTINTTNSTQRLLSGNNIYGSLIISNNHVDKVLASNGAVIFELTPNQTLNISLIDNNLDTVSALERGGIAYINQPSLVMKNNIGTSINATISGPVLFSISDQINLINSSNSFDGPQNAPLFAFYPTNIEIAFISISDSSVLPLENYNTLSTNPIVPNLTSYSLTLYQIRLTLVYSGIYGDQTVVDVSPGASVLLTFISPPTSAYPNQTYYTNCQNSTCLASPSSVVLEGEAGDLYLVNVTYESSSFTQFQQFSISLRGCEPGELNQSGTGVCIYCSIGTYSLSPADKSCLDCPYGADCRGGNDIWIQPGFYRSENTSGLYILPCNDSAVRCLGGEGNNCSEGYDGPFCLQCDQSEGYIPDSGSDCVKCDNSGSNLAKEILLILGGLVYQLIMVVLSYIGNKTNFQQKAATTTAAEENSRPVRPADIMLVLTTFAQVCSIIAVANLDQGFLDSFTNVFTSVSNPNKQVVSSLKCLYYQPDMDPLYAMKLEILLYIFLPLAKLLVAALFELLRMIVKRFKEAKINAVKRLGAVTVALILLEQPSIIGALSNYFTCERLDPYVDIQFMKNPTAIQCYTPDYNSFRDKAVIPAIILWGAGVPLTIFVILRKNRQKLQTSELLNIIFGALYTSFTKEAYYWGVGILLFKMVIFILNSVLTVPVVTSSTILLIIIQIYYELFNSQPPYSQKLMLRCEKYCLFSYRVILILVMLSGSVQNDVLELACDILILIAVIIPGLYLLIWMIILRFKAIKTQISTIKEKIKKKFAAKEEFTSTTIKLELPNSGIDMPSSPTEGHNLEIWTKRSLFSIPETESKFEAPESKFEAPESGTYIPSSPTDLQSPDRLTKRLFLFSDEKELRSNSIIIPLTPAEEEREEKRKGTRRIKKVTKIVKKIKKVKKRIEENLVAQSPEMTLKTSPFIEIQTTMSFPSPERFKEDF